MDGLAPQEAAVLALIKANPFVSQQEIASQLGLARSTVAAHVVQLVNKGHVLGRGYLLPSEQRVICIGGAVLDRKYQARDALVFGTSNPVSSARSFGGVARNVAENLARLGTPTGFVSMVGADETGQAILGHMRDCGIDVSQVTASAECQTAEYAAILDAAGDLVFGISDMGIFDLIRPAHIERAWSHLAAASWVFCDCNLPAETLAFLISKRSEARFRLAVDVVSTPKAARLPEDLSGIDLLYMNLDEANAVLRLAGDDMITNADAAIPALQAAGARDLVITMGARGMCVASGGEIRSFPAVEARPVDMTGAGDAMIAGTINRLLQGDDLFQAARIGALLATLTTESPASVHTELSERFLSANMHRLDR